MQLAANSNTFFLILGSRPLLDAEFNSASNGDSFKGVIYQKRQFDRTNWDFDRILVVYLADIRFWTSVGFLIGCTRCRF